MSDVQAQIKKLIEDNEVVLFMKGNRHFPQCGFSARTVGILNEYLGDYETVNVLADPNMRSGIKEFSNWPTIPQLYVKAEFIGGCDITTELHESGELGETLGVTLEEIAAPELTVTAAAAEAIKNATDDDSQHLRFSIGARFDYEMHLDAQRSTDIVVESNGITVLLDRGTAKRASGTVIDYETTSTGAGFVVNNPNEPAKVQQISPAALKELMDSGREHTLFDVRSEEEREICKIDSAIHLTQESIETHLKTLPKDSTLVFQCHHGGRSQQAAEFFLEQGFTQVFNLVGGINAWADEIDPDLARY